jgi:uncharacterized protein YhjY with autotransporter beta-barrel domain
MSFSKPMRLQCALLFSSALLFPAVAANAADNAMPPVDTLQTPWDEPENEGELFPLPVPVLPRSTLLPQPVETPFIAINNTLTPTDARDPININGIGQIVVDNGGGSVGLCTATKINARVVLFAAHCVNNRAATDYGANSGGRGIAVAFETNTRANAAGQPDELVNWLLGSGGGSGQFQTNSAQSLYNLSQVFWNTGSVSAASCINPTSCSLEADLATGIMDTPSPDAIPSWALLFSPLPDPGTIDPANGTGYHVSLQGYGRFGTGTTGQNGGNDFRRRAAENMLGALTSISSRNLFLFGTAGTPARPQLLYWLDFDDPARADPRDFNGFRDNALPREGQAVESGDSGGPLIVDQAYARQLVIGVLSGGSTFFAGQPAGSYGSQAFYQPLFLNWDWIVANNPYRYVTATAGNRNWEDASAWVTELDPAYYVISGVSATNRLGTATNGLPTNLGGTNIVTAPAFGETCFQSAGTNECQDIATGTIRNGIANTPGAGPGAFVPPVAGAGFSATATPAPTLANGLPGATNFVPNNVDGVRATGVAGRYYDVTLRNNGTVTLNSTVTVDRFTMMGAQSQLSVASGASLTSLLQLSHMTGIVNVNGTINAPGEYLFTSGLLTGTGRVNTPFLTTALGNIAPGTLGTTGTLTIGGNLVMSSGSTYVVDLGAGGTSDRIAVVSTAAPGTGLANVGGTVLLSPTAGTSIRAGDTYTILTAQNGVTGTFSPTSSLSAILRPQFIYSANAVQLRIAAGSYVDVATGSTVQRAYAALLDRNRGNAPVSTLHDILDIQSAGTIQATLDSWAPRGEPLKSAIGTTALDNMSRFYRSRIAGMDIANGLGGTIATVGSPTEAISRLSYGTDLRREASLGGGQDSEMSNALPETMSAFFAGGYLDGKSSSMATAVPFGGDDNFDGYYLAAGIETELGSNAGIGFGLSYTDIDGTTGGATHGASGQLYQGTLYGKLQSNSGLTFDTQLSAALFSAKTERTAVLGLSTFDLQSKDDTLALSAEVGVSKQFDIGSLQFGPRAAMRASRIEFTPTVERGGPMALAFDRGQYDSLQGLLGFTLGGGMKFRPYASAYFAHDFEDKPAAFGANFVSGVGLPAAFALAGQDKNWFEVSAGIGFGSETFQLSLGADTTIGRSDVSNQSYRGSVTFRF